jgi:hypothetical protein
MKKCRTDSWSPFEWLNEKVDNAATCETNSKRIVIGVTKRDNSTWLFAGQDCECFRYNCALNAPATDAANDFSVFVYGHCGACSTWARTLNVDDARKSNALTCCSPAIDVV